MRRFPVLDCVPLYPILLLPPLSLLLVLENDITSKFEPNGDVKKYPHTTK